MSNFTNETPSHQPNLDDAKKLRTSFEKTRLHLLESRDQFNSKPIDGLEEWSITRGESSSASIRPPSAIAADVADQMSFLRKLKFQYLEQNAKDKYVKTIVNDEAPAITADDNADLRLSNQRKKEALKAAKLRLAEKYDDIRRLAPLVEHDYNKARDLTNDTVTLTQSVLDARLAIKRLRQAHPHPRLTIPAAEDKLALQVSDMQMLEDELQHANEQVVRVKERVREGAKEAERLRVEKSEVEKEVSAIQVRDEAEDGRVVGLNDWYTAQLALHRALISMHSSHSVSENELRLTYLFRTNGSATQKGSLRKVTIVLLFLPNTRQLADARIEGVDGVDLRAVVMAYAQANDAPALMANSHKVKIAARLRPSIKGELLDEGVRVEPSDDGPSCICVTNPRDNSQVFRFPAALLLLSRISSCYDHTSTQEDIFHNDVEPLIDVVYSGVTVTIFAYGVTSSGKTHTMQGTKTDPGVIPRVVRALFERRASIEQHQTSISVSYMEIYKDEVYDLMVDRDNAQKLPVRENDAGQVFVANLNSTAIESAEEFEKLYSMANKQRSVGATLLNRASSRSHAIVTIEVKMTNQAENKIITGKINLVDLAGSENNKVASAVHMSLGQADERAQLTGNDPSRMAESAAINKSLSVLGQVVHALNQGAPRIPYRNSKLTRILQDALGGASVGLLICNLAPGSKFRQDTLNTLNFAVRTKNIENKPVVNERDNRPAPKQHFAAVQAPAPASKPANLPVQSIAGPSRPSIVSSRNAGSLSGLAGPSRVPRISAVGGSAPYPGASKRRESRIGTVQSHRDSQGLNLSEKEIDDRISKAVEAEVARRLEERLKEEEERRARERAEAEPKQQESPQLPSGLLTPLLKRHQDLDNELRKRLQDLESKYERGNKELTLKEGLSPVSRKKTGRAYVALARAHSEKGDLQNALDLYRRAETYVPDNVKLKERIIEIEWAVKNGTEFQPSPKRPRKAKSKKSRSRKAKVDNSRGSENAGSQGAASFNPADSDDDDTVENLLEVTNSPRKLGRSGNAHGSGDDATTTPRKPRNRKRAADSDDEWAPSAPTKKVKAAANIRSGA
ncbi:hypothetical protein EVG20_g2693 [Dentipellis fragilis]|uniref:Kinesin motor domain-containing protein n=1 Tax=Dentipellis fragilis TaxID=205917 RepID=A0A4Y9Z778_9AGAM|nr:hypothetical protein EVG20_g2693 [Dentipellis fragilis]